MSELLPPTGSSELAEIKRRLDRLENSARVPQITRAGIAGIRARVLDLLNGQLSSSSAVEASDLDFPAEVGPEVDVQTSATGRLLLLYGTTLEGWAGSGEHAYYFPQFFDADGNLLIASNIIILSSSERATVTTAAVESTLPPNSVVTVRMKYGKDAGGFVAGFAFPWLVVLPL